MEEDAPEREPKQLETVLASEAESMYWDRWDRTTTPIGLVIQKSKNTIIVAKKSAHDQESHYWRHPYAGK